MCSTCRVRAAEESGEASRHNQPTNRAHRVLCTLPRLKVVRTHAVLYRSSDLKQGRTCTVAHDERLRTDADGDACGLFCRDNSVCHASREFDSYEEPWP